MFIYSTLLKRKKINYFSSTIQESCRWLLPPSISLILPSALGPGVHSAYNRNEQDNTVSGTKAWLVRRADNLTAICEPIVYTIWGSQHLTTL
jgi:hypothetical protein